MPNFLLKIIQFFYPNYCSNCGKLLTEYKPNCFCKECWSKIKIIKTQSCKKCGKPIITADGICAECKKRKGTFYQKMRAVGLYEDILKQAIQLYKFYERWKISRDFAELIINNIEPEYITENDIIVPVPLSKEKLAQRGFSQTFLIAKELGKYYNVLVCNDILLKIKDTPAQANLMRQERLLNLTGSFGINKKRKAQILNKNILLFDDVYTTGTTVTECSKVLKENGAKNINVLTLARGV